MEPPGSVSAVVRVTGTGSGLPLETTVATGPTISVLGRLCGSAEGMNSCTVPVTVTKSPMATPGVEEVNTARPSEVVGSPSSSALPSGVWMKKVLLVRPVTMPAVVTVCPTSGDVVPAPWTASMATVGGGGGGGASQSTGACALLRGLG